MSTAGDDISLKEKLRIDEKHVILKSEEWIDKKELPVFKKVGRRWKTLPEKGDDVTIKDPRLKQGYLGDLKKKSIIELEDALRRQDLILSNKNMLSKLPDKGERLKSCRKEIAEALEEAKEYEKNLKATKLPIDIQALEWHTNERGENQMTTRNMKTLHHKCNNYLDSDDEEDLDPLELMARHSSCVKKPIHGMSWYEEEDPAAAITRELQQMELSDALKSEKSKEGQVQDFERCRDTRTAKSSAALDFGTKRIQMLELKHFRNGDIREPFKPFRPIADPQPIPDLQKLIESHRPKSDRKVQQISLQESITLERQYLAKTKELELKKTTDILSRIKSEKIEIGIPPEFSSFKYRDTNVNDHLLDSDEEDHCYLPANSDYDHEEQYDDD